MPLKIPVLCIMRYLPIRWPRFWRGSLWMRRNNFCQQGCAKEVCVAKEGEQGSGSLSRARMYPMPVPCSLLLLFLVVLSPSAASSSTSPLACCSSSSPTRAQPPHPSLLTATRLSPTLMRAMKSHRRVAVVGARRGAVARGRVGAAGRGLLGLAAHGAPVRLEDHARLHGRRQVENVRGKQGKGVSGS